MDRRTFLQTAGIGGAAIAASTGLAGNVFALSAEVKNDSKKVPKRTLGRSGIPVSILSLGGGMDWTTNQNLLRMALAQGVTFWDTSDRYENGKSEMGIGQYFNKYPENREEVFLCTKASGKTDPGQVSAAIDQSLERMQTDYIDLFLLTLMPKMDKFPDGLKALIEKKKREGKIKLVGFSGHLENDRVVAKAVDMGWIDALMITYNYILMQKDDIKRQIDAAAKAGIGLIAIKSQGMSPDAAENSQTLEAMQHFMEKGFTLEQAKLKAVWRDERIASICSNINNFTILKDNAAAARDTSELSIGDLETLRTLASAECSHYCQGCGSCIAAMGAESRIPDVLRYMMYYNSYGHRDLGRKLYGELPVGLRSNIGRKDYTAAESACPHKLQIGSLMRKAATLLS